MITAIGSLRETVTLGTFPVGTYPYEVEIHPAFTVNWGTRTMSGASRSFTGPHSVYSDNLLEND